MSKTPHASSAKAPHPRSNREERPSHDHASCVAEALAAAEAVCDERGAALTPIRRRVLELVWSSHAPIGAYEILSRLAEESGRVQPPTVYRALDFLRQQGLVHRIESRNAFIGCDHPERDHEGQFLLCRACGEAEELIDEKVLQPLERQAKARGFLLERRTVELEGLCPRCQERAAEERP